MNELCGKPLEGELELINKYTRRNLTDDEVYVFSLVLCDNEIDRDFERFSPESLQILEKLFVGVTGIADHNPETKNQSARIFSCKTELVPDKLTSDGQPFYRLKARAYMPKSEGNEELILSLDSGIKKEVSVGCAVKKRICSICGDDISCCNHMKGGNYDGNTCVAILDEPFDAYEWSFVAVPAQKQAGVVKSFINGGNIMDNIEKKLSSGEQQTLSGNEAKALAEKIRILEKKARDGELYRRSLANELKKFAAMTFPEIDSGTIEDVSENMTVEQLTKFKDALQKKASQIFPAKPQLFKENNKQKIDNKLYKNI